MNTAWLADRAPWSVVAILSFTWLLIGLGTGLSVQLLPRGFLARDTWLTRPRRFERSGRFYDTHLSTKRWKDRLPEAGALLGRGGSKRHLAGAGDQNLFDFCAETRRAEYVHWMNIAAGPGFVLVLPAWVAAVVTGFAVMAHLPFIVVQRYNRLRIDRILTRRSERDPVGPR